MKVCARPRAAPCSVAPQRGRGNRTPRPGTQSGYNGAMKWMRRLGLVFAALLIGPLYMALFGNISFGEDWRTADRSSTGIAPDPETVREAVVQVYAARAFNWRGVFAVHTWIAVKPRAAAAYTIHEVLGWQAWHGLPVLMSHRGVPDRAWYGAAPEVLADLRGPAAAASIPTIADAVRRYPFPRTYRLWPGPNSNTFTAWVGRQVPALALELPTTAIGKDFLANGSVIARAPSGSGYQISALGLIGVLLARREGLELNVLGLSFGIDPLRPAIKLPGIGRIGAGARTRTAAARD